MATTYSVESGAIMELTMIAALFDQVVMTVRHYRLELTGGGTDTDGPTALNEFFTEQVDGAPGLIANDVIPCLSQDVVTIKWKMQWIKPTRYAPIIAVGTDEIGGEASASEPPGVAAAVTLRAVTTGRHSRGTIHFPGVPKTWSVTGRINAPGQAAYGNAGAAYRRVLTSVDTFKVFNPIIYYRELPELSQDVAGYEVQNTVRTMRRRVVGRGI